MGSCHTILFLLSARLFAGGLAAGSPEIVLDDPSGVLGRTRAPMSVVVMLDAQQWHAVREGRLYLREKCDGKLTGPPLPAQLEGTKGRGRLWWLMPSGPAGQRTFTLMESDRPLPAQMQARKDEAGGQIEVTDIGRPVLRYNYATIEPGELLQQVAEGNRIYARARSNYIHPLYGPDGEVMTKDWPLDHPHHRGIYWAWPEVQYGDQLGDLHALQRIFARPTGKVVLESGPVYAQIKAENLWQWEDRTPIVREWATIRAYPASRWGRIIDLVFRFDALEEGVTLARRGTELYGGLNIRCSAVANQQITFHTDPTGTEPRKAWGTLSGVFQGGRQPIAFTVFQHASNPHYPGDWVEYPNLNWFQPTFPAARTRYPLRKGETLTLRFRLWIRPGGRASDEACAEQWKVYNERRED